MTPGARTPEELETLFEDAFVFRDGDAVAGLFEEGGLLVMSGAPGEARGGSAIARVAAELCKGDLTYLADPRRVLQARTTALVVHNRGANVVRRGRDGMWRYAISLLALDHTSEGEQT